MVPAGEECTWRTPDNPCRFRDFDMSPGFSTIGSFSKVLMFTVRLSGPQVKSIKAIEVEVPATAMRCGYDIPLAINVKECWSVCSS